MPQDRKTTLGAMFDIKPIDQNGKVDFNQILNIQPTIDLSNYRPRVKKPILLTSRIYKRIKKDRIKKLTNFKLSETIKSDLVTQDNKNLVVSENYQEILERFLNENLDSEAELINLGGKIQNWRPDLKPRYKKISRSYRETINQVKSKLESENEATTQKPLVDLHSDSIEAEFQNQDFDYNRTLSEINRRGPMVQEPILVGEPRRIDLFSLGLVQEKKAVLSSIELDTWLDNFKKESKQFKKIRWPKFSYLGITLAGLMFVSISYFSGYGINVKSEIVQEGNLAIENLQNAGNNLKAHDFIAATNNFGQAYDSFSKAGQNLNFMGASISSLLTDLPGTGKLKSAKNLIEAGKLIANAGQALSEAINQMAKTSLILNPNAGNGPSIGKIVQTMQKALDLSEKNIKKARVLLVDVDEKTIPEGKRSSFEDFNSKLPIFEKLITDSADYAKFLGNLIGVKDTKNYLILFQNQAELRPTGGFPGSYGVMTFKNGRLEDFRIDDIYNLDGQLKELIVPPFQLQHITPNWGMRDANWFIDFPTSAKKISEFFYKESSFKVDGVITINPRIISSMLGILGSIEMPDYGLTLDSKNFQTSVQNEVEYKGDRTQPKKILIDLGPKLLEKMYTADSQKWLDIFNLILTNLEQKDILMYFKDLSLEDFAIKKGFSGKVENKDSDYLMVTFSNIKGSKTDSVIDNSIKINTQIRDGVIKHKLNITREHNGGGSQYGFFNKKSPAYVRILVPEDAELISLVGSSHPEYEPLLDYSRAGFEQDRDLVKLESSIRYDKKSGAAIFKESGKTEFGFWVIVDPGQTKKVELEYFLPAKTNKDYSLYVQKQPGLRIEDFEFNFTASGEQSLENAEPILNKVGDNYILKGILDKDLDLKFQLISNS